MHEVMERVCNDRIGFDRSAVVFGTMVARGLYGAMVLGYPDQGVTEAEVRVVGWWGSGM